MMKVIVVVVVFFLIAFIWAFFQYDSGEGERAKVSDTSGKILKNFEGEEIIVEGEGANFEFEGYAVGKSHIGKFDDWKGSLYMDEDEIVGFEGFIQADSVSTGIEGLDSHLRSDDFFAVKKYPEIRFVSIDIDSENSHATGNLVFKGITKEVAFPISVTKGGVSGEFFLDTEPFGFKYAAVNKEVRIKFDIFY
jgi:polyisoprenoid-binding protein YceI